MAASQMRATVLPISAASTSAFTSDGSDHVSTEVAAVSLSKLSLNRTYLFGGLSPLCWRRSSTSWGVAVKITFI